MKQLLALSLLPFFILADGQERPSRCDAVDPTHCSTSSQAESEGFRSKTATEVSAGVDFVNTLYPVGDIRRYDASKGIDYSAAIAAAYNVAAAGVRTLTIPAGTFNYSKPISLGSAPISWHGAGSGQSILQYNGNSATQDCIVIGDGKKEIVGLTMEGIGFRSSTLMTAGAGVHFRHLARSTLRDVRFGEQDSVRSFFYGLWLDGVDFVTISQFQAWALQDAVRVNGISGGPQADLFIWGGKIGGAAIGLHVGGAMGGMTVDATDIIGNAVNMKVDHSIVPDGNREIFLGAQVALDSAGTSALPYSGTDLLVDDSKGSLIFLNDTWIASASRLVDIKAIGGFFKMTGGFLFNAFNSYGGDGNAIDIDQPDTAVRLFGTRFRTINGTAVSCAATSPCGNVSMSNVVYDRGVTHTLTNIEPATTIAAPGRLVAGGGATRGNFALAADANPAQYFYQSESLGRATGIGYFGPTSLGSWIEMYKSRGIAAATHGAVAAQDALGSISFSGDNGAQPVAAAQISASVDGTPSATSMPGMLRFSTTPIGAANPANRLIIGNQGNIVINSPNSGDPLTVKGMQAGSGVSGWVCYDKRTGRFSYDAANTCAVSDGALKTDIRNIGWEAGKELALLKPISYRCRRGTLCEASGEQLGFDARAVAKVDGRLLSYREDGTPSSVDYSKVGVLLVGALQAQQRELLVLWVLLGVLLVWCARLQWHNRRK